MSRVADDFVIIAQKLKKLTALPEVKRSGSPMSHCSHCPKMPDENCSLNCKDEGQKVGVI